MIILSSERPPVRRDRPDCDAVSRAELRDLIADRLDDPDSLVTECQVLPVSNRTVDGVDIGGTDESLCRADDSVRGAWFRYIFVDESSLADSVHYECIHWSSLCCNRRELTA